MNILPKFLLKQLKQQYKILLYELEYLSEWEIREQVIEDKWSIFENMAHIGRYQEIFITRIQMILANQNPSFERYVAEEDSEFTAWLKLPLAEMQKIIKGQRKEVVKFVEDLKDEDLSKVGTHLKFGVMNIPQWIEFFLLHEAHHLYTIFKLRAEIKQKSPAIS
jgi:uncharacterized damage-inducible protein DinB